MKDIIDTRSLYQTVLNAAVFLFKGGEFSGEEKESLIDYVLTRQNRTKGYVFRPTADELAGGVHLISGEKPRTKLLAKNAVELETLRLLALLGDGKAEVQEVFQAAEKRLDKTCFSRVCLTGDCVGASIAYLRYITARDPNNGSERIRHGLDLLKENRTGDGKWGKFPYFFTLLWLEELPAIFAHEELAYTREAARRYFQNPGKRIGAYREFQDLLLEKAIN